MYQNLTIANKTNLWIFCVAIITLLIGYFILNLQATKIEQKVNNDFKISLQDELKIEFDTLKSIGISNGTAISNDGYLRYAMESGNKDLAITTIQNLIKRLETTIFKNQKIHIHTTDNTTYFKSWAVNQKSEDLSDFRPSVVKVNKTLKPINTFEIGKDGLYLRSVVPIISFDGVPLGSLEFIQGVDSIAQELDKNGFVLLMDKKATNLPIKNQNKTFQSNYIIAQEYINKEFLDDLSSVDIQNLLKNEIHKSKKYLYTYIPIKHFEGKQIGIAIIGTPVEHVDLAADSAKEIITLSMMIMLGLIVFLIILVYFIVKSMVVRPVLEFKNRINEMVSSNSSDNQARIEKKSNDELGDLTDSFNSYLQKIDNEQEQDRIVIDDVTKLVKEVSLGNLDAQITATSSSSTVTELVNNINKMIHTLNLNINHSLNILEQYRNEDFTHKTTLQSQGQIKQLMDDINNLGEVISKMLNDNLKNGNILQKSSTKLVDNMHFLNQNSSGAAESIEQTTHSVDTITKSIRNTTDNTIKMSSYATKLSASANEGEQLASKTNISMDEINEKVELINEAIVFIEQITLQTKILSLNAAVEAATSGEAGKGFAVVANEVGNLATRSAEAAKSIQDLVASATDKAHEGKEIANMMITGYNNLNKNISQTVNIINDVEQISKDQLSQIEQINDSIKKLDSQTVKNASIANITNDIAKETSIIANTIVTDVNTKRFKSE